MKTISEQLKDLGLKHGDLCEIEGVEGRQNVCNCYKSEDCFVMLKSGVSVACEKMQVICGWKAGRVVHMDTEDRQFRIHYNQVFPAPVPKPLPEAVEKMVREADWLDSTKELMRDFARAILDEAAKPKGTIADIIGANPVYGPKKT